VGGTEQRGVQGTPHIAFCLSLLLLKKCLQVALRSQILIPHFCEIGVLALEVGQDEPLLISLDCGVFFDADVVIAPVVGSEFEFVSSFCQFKEHFRIAHQIAVLVSVMRYRDELLVFLDGSLGIRQGELGVLRWLDCDFENMCFSVQHSYYWRRGGNLKSTKTEASAKPLPMHPSLKDALVEWRSQSLYNGDEDFVFASERLKGQKPLDLASVLKKKIQPAFKSVGIIGVGWHTFRHTLGTMLAEMGEHQLTIRDYLRHANLHVTNKYLQATSKSKRLAQDKLDAILPVDFLRMTQPPKTVPHRM